MNEDLSKAHFWGFHPLWIEKQEDRKWKLIRDLAFYSVKYQGWFVVPSGFITDFATIPRILWRLYPPVGNYDAAAVLHDAGYAKRCLTIEGVRQHTTKEVSDNLFLEALLSLKVNRLTAEFMYRAVKTFGKS